MIFTTLPFAVFFAVVFFGYYALPAQRRWWLLLAASVFFYAYMTPYYLIFLGVAAIATYLGAIGIDNNLKRQRAWISANGKTIGREAKRAYKSCMERQRNRIVVMVAVVVVGMLVVFKYLDFAFSNITWLGGALGLDFKFSGFNLARASFQRNAGLFAIAREGCLSGLQRGS